MIEEKILLPTRWDAALDAFEASTVLPKYLDQRYHKLYATCRREECERFHAEISNRDYEWYLRVICGNGALMTRAPGCAPRRDRPAAPRSAD